MKNPNNVSSSFHEEQVLHELAHYLPAQAPLKDFIHHNTLHAFQHEKFFDGILEAKSTFGYKTLLSPQEYKKFYSEGKISEEKLLVAIEKNFPEENSTDKLNEILTKDFQPDLTPRVGAVRMIWKDHYHFDVSALVHHIVFRITCNYLDQGIALWQFPSKEKGLLNAARDLDKHTAVSLFRSKKVVRFFMIHR